MATACVSLGVGVAVAVLAGEGSVGVEEAAGVTGIADGKGTRDPQPVMMSRISTKRQKVV